MKICVITGSARGKGTSSRLADAFIKGAEAAGHDVFRFDAPFHRVHPCIACNTCRKGEAKGCMFGDDMRTVLVPKLIEADAVVFASPIYFAGLSAQLKAVIDRFYGYVDDIKGNKKTALLLSFGDETLGSAEGAIMTYRHMADYLGWENRGVLTAIGCYTPDDLLASDFLYRAVQMGATI
ncbi:MAG: flavodoxin family protein [Eubacteriaceae bacterium]|nr:flavodoxin family protein [Eubacteriaceae bacterium]